LKKNPIKETIFFQKTYNLIGPTDHSHPIEVSDMGWLRWVGCLKIQVSLQNTGLFCRALLQKRPIFLSILLIPYQMSESISGVFLWCCLCLLNWCALSHFGHQMSESIYGVFSHDIYWVISDILVLSVYSHGVVCVHIHTYDITHTNTHAHTHASTHIHTHSLSHTHTHTHKHTHTHTHTHTNTHNTHTQISSQSTCLCICLSVYMYSHGVVCVFSWCCLCLLTWNTLGHFRHLEWIFEVWSPLCADISFFLVCEPCCGVQPVRHVYFIYLVIQDVRRYIWRTGCAPQHGTHKKNKEISGEPDKNIWISRSTWFPGRSFEWQGLHSLT